MKMLKSIALSAVMFILFILVVAGCSNEAAKSAEVKLQSAPKAVINDVSVDYVIASSWNTGFQANVTITNNGSSAIDGWTLEWDFTDGQTVDYAWNAESSQSGSTVTMSNVSFNGTIAPGAEVSFGFIGTCSGANSVPESFSLNGSSSGNGPQVSVTAPVNNTQYSEGDDIIITADASDSDGTITSVEFYNGSTLLGTDSSAPYEYIISNAAVATYSLSVKATDNDGLSATSSVVTVTVGGGSDEGIVISDAAPVKIEAEDYTAMSGIDTEEASEGTLNIGWIETGDYVDYDVRVDTAGTYEVEYRIASEYDSGSFSFMLGSTKLGDISVPNTGAWQTWDTVSHIVNLSTGENTIRLLATGDYWNLNYFVITKVTIDPTAPEVSITSPSNNASFSVGSDITIKANATDLDGSITSVAFYNGSTLLGTDSTAPFEYTMSNAALGTYSFTAKATDNDGQSTTSSVVTVTVKTSTNTKVCALTFDDGPDNYKTGLVLDKLESYGVTASFFVIGQKISSSTQATLQRMLSMGCDIQNHSWGYDSLNSLSAQQVMESVNNTTAAIEQYTGTSPSFFRPPNLATSSTMFSAIDLPFASGVLAYDWDAGTSDQQRADNVLNNMRDGAIILLHDVQNHQTDGTLDILIPELQSRGYDIVTLPELFRRKNVDPDSLSNAMWQYVE